MSVLRDFFQPPSAVEQVGDDVPKPACVPHPGRAISANITALRTDGDVYEFLGSNKQQTHPQFAFAVAQVDSMADAAKHVRYTPTTIFHKGGKKVDEVIGKDVQRLTDHFWLHSDL